MPVLHGVRTVAIILPLSKSKDELCAGYLMTTISISAMLQNLGCPTLQYCRKQTCLFLLRFHITSLLILHHLGSTISNFTIFRTLEQIPI